MTLPNLSTVNEEVFVFLQEGGATAGEHVTVMKLTVIVLLLVGGCGADAVKFPRSVDCQSMPQSAYKFCDPTLTVEERTSDLVRPSFNKAHVPLVMQRVYVWLAVVPSPCKRTSMVT